MDLNRLGQGHRIAAGAGLLLLIDLWLSWYSINDDFLRGLGGATGVDTSATAWQAFSFTDLLLFALVVVAIAAAVQSLGKLQLPKRLSDILFPFAVVMTVIVLYRIINQPSDNDAIDVSFGAYLGLILTAAIAYGASKARAEPELVGPADLPDSKGATTPPPAAATPPPAATPPAAPPPPAAPADPAPPATAHDDDTPPPPAPPATTL